MPFDTMAQNVTFIILLMLSQFEVFAQKHDYVWVAGRENTPGNTDYGGSVIDFNQNPVAATYHYREMNMFVCNASICDSSGRLIAYSNGCDIAGEDDEILDNGEVINPGVAHQVSCVQNADGYASGIQSAMFIPLPGNDSTYYLFHKQMKLVFNPTDAFTEKLLYSVVKKNILHGWSVTSKNVEIIKDTLSYGKLVAVKHSNGDDWWVTTPKRRTNEFYTLRLTAAGVIDTLKQSVGIAPDYTTEGYGQIVFSPDGNKLYRTNPSSPVMVYDFDRETGVFTQFDTIHYDYGEQLVGEIGCAVSPSGRFLYLSCRKFLYQLDLWAADVSASQTTVAEWDGFADPIPTLFWQCQLGPDCKVYIQGGDTRYYHVVHYPDEPGLACGVEQRGLVLPTPCGASMPSFPNYRLGPLGAEGLPCTATVGAPALPPLPVSGLRIWPNPADGQLVIAYDFAAMEERQLLIFDAYGRTVKALALSGTADKVTLSTADWPSGIYWYTVPAATAPPLSGKISIVH
jgi:hypothetical protein